MRLKNTKYQTLLNDRRWQVRADKIRRRDNYKCQNPHCLSGNNEPVDVHHKFYVWDRKPWLYSDEVLTTICRSCHSALHDKEQMQVYQDDYQLIKERDLTRLTNLFLRYFKDADFRNRVDCLTKKFDINNGIERSTVHPPLR